MGFIKKAVFVVFIAWLFLRITVLFKSLLTLGLGTPIFSHAPGPCKIFHVNGSEDIDLLPNGLAVISSGLIYVTGSYVDPAMFNREGKLYAFNFNTPDEDLKEITLEGFDKSGFVPHGIDFYTDPTTQETWLFVINHGGKESIEIFKFDEEQLVLKHRKTVTDKNIYFPNNLVAVGLDSFYVTNDHYFNNQLLAKLEVFYPLKLGNVVFYNGTNADIVASNMRMPNGINMDKTGKYVYVADCVDGKIFVFKRGELDNSLEKQQVISLGHLIENIHVDDGNNLWTGGFAGLSFLEYNKNFSKPCPAKVLQVKLSTQNDAGTPFKVDDIVEVYSNRGDGDFKGATSAVFYKGKLLMGSAFSNLMYCDVVAV